MDRRQARHEIRRRALGLSNGLMRSVLTARNTSFTWNVGAADLRYCEDSKSTPSLYQPLSDTQLTSDHSTVIRLRDHPIDTSHGFASMRERKLFSFNQELLHVKPVEEPLTLMTLAAFEKDQIITALSDLCGREVSVTNYRTTFLQYLQLCRKLNIQFRVQLASNLTQCLTCLKHAPVSVERFKCSCILFRFQYLQDCNCECGISHYCCMCDDFPPVCYDLDVLADFVTALLLSLESLFHTGLEFMELAMSPASLSEIYGDGVRIVSATIRLCQFEPP